MQLVYSGLGADIVMESLHSSNITIIEHRECNRFDYKIERDN